MTGDQLLEALPVAIYTTDAEGRITFFNEAAAAFWGHRPTLGSDQWCGSWRLFWPDGRPLPHDQCPMALTLKEGRPIRGVEAVAERPDGTRVSFMPYPTPLHDESGRLIGAINLLVDLTDQNRRELDSAQLAAIVASSDDAIVSKTLQGRVVSWNAGAARIFGYDASEMIGQPILRLIPPELQGQEAEILAKLKRGEHIDHYETVRVAKDGRRLDVSLTVSPVRDKFGNIVGASKVARDVTERKQAERFQRLLIEELNHRVKNMLASVQAIANQSLRHARNPAEFASSFTGRVQALARVHSLLTGPSLQGADLGRLVRDQVLLSEEDDRISCSGPSVTLEPKAATHLALILHELGTNARKYGALSVPAGRLALTWSVETNGARNLHLVWTESGGPTVSVPSTRGFGTTLIEQTLRGQGGGASLQYAEHGLTCELRLPLVDEVQISIEGHAEPRHAEAEVQLALQPARQSLAGKRILVIEDEAFVAMDIEDTLNEAGCLVLGPVATLEKGKALIADTDCDAALLDANLSGYPVDELAALLTQKNIPFAFVTGYGREALPEAFRASAVLAKPFNAEQLRTLVRVLLRDNDGVVRLRKKTKPTPR